MERLSSQVLKMICIPAVMQGLSNPVPELELPEWLQKKTFDMRHHRQNSILSFGVTIKQNDYAERMIEEAKNQASNSSPMKIR